MESQSGGPLGVIREPEIFLDGIPVEFSSLENHPLSAVRSHLETLALEKQCVLCAMEVDGLALDLGKASPELGRYTRVEAESVTLEDSEVLLLRTALQQISHVRDSVEAALTLVLINNGQVAREIWWNLAQQLKGPILTLSLLPDNVCPPAGGGASFKKIRKWQLEKVASITREMNLACRTGETLLISDVLEKRVLPWLGKLEDLTSLWYETVQAAGRLGIRDHTF